MTADVVQMNEQAYELASQVVKRGRLIVYPTDTVYGLGCDPFNSAAVARLFRAKGRTSKAVPVLCSSPRKAQELVKLSPKALRLAMRHWPGALTIVAPSKKRFPDALTQGSPNLGVRVPAHAGCLALISRCGGWLTGTSANLSGSPSARSASDARSQLGERVDLIIDGGDLGGSESTVVEIVGDAVTLLRTGPIGVEDEMTGRRIS